MLAPSVHADNADAFAPSAVVFVDAGLFAVVSWAPGHELADSYRVYGVSASGLVLLADVAIPEHDAVVPGGYGNYAVSGVSGDDESGAVRGCIVLEYNPPDIERHPPCSTVGQASSA